MDTLSKQTCNLSQKNQLFWKENNFFQETHFLYVFEQSYIFGRVLRQVFHNLKSEDSK